MADDVGLKIGLEGEKEFKKALSEINQSFKVLGSEMKPVSSQFDKNDQSVEALTARNTVLNKEIEAQKQKIETLKKALENAATSFGENDRRTQAWQIQLNNAEAALNDMERELQQNNDALDRAAGEFDDAEKQADDFGDEVEDAGKQSDDAGDKFEKLGAVCKAAGVAIAAAFAAVSAAAVAAGKALVDMAVEGAAYADTVLTESTVTGIATDKLQEYTPLRWTDGLYHYAMLGWAFSLRLGAQEYDNCRIGQSQENGDFITKERFAMNKTITHYKKTNTRLKNDYHGKRTISKDEATAHGLFKSRKTAGCVKPLTVFSENSLKKPCKIEKMSKNQGRNH